MPTPELLQMTCSGCGRALRVAELPADQRIPGNATTELHALFETHREAHLAATAAGWLLGVVAPRLDLCPACGPSPICECFGAYEGSDGQWFGCKLCGGERRVKLHPDDAKAVSDETEPSDPLLRRLVVAMLAAQPKEVSP